MAEWLKAHAWKVCLGETLTEVRILSCPPLKNIPKRGVFLWVEGMRTEVGGLLANKMSGRPKGGSGRNKGYARSNPLLSAIKKTSRKGVFFILFEGASTVEHFILYLNFVVGDVLRGKIYPFHENDLLIRVIYSQLNSMDECFARI